MADDDKFKVVARNSPEAIAKHRVEREAEQKAREEARKVDAREKARERQRRYRKVEALEGMRFSVRVYLVADSTENGYIREFDMGSMLRFSELPSNTPIELIAEWCPAGGDRRAGGGEQGRG